MRKRLRKPYENAWRIALRSYPLISWCSLFIRFLLFNKKYCFNITFYPNFYKNSFYKEIISPSLVNQYLAEVAREREREQKANITVHITVTIHASHNLRKSGNLIIVRCPTCTVGYAILQAIYWYQIPLYDRIIPCFLLANIQELGKKIKPFIYFYMHLIYPISSKNELGISETDAIDWHFGHSVKIHVLNNTCISR